MHSKIQISKVENKLITQQNGFVAIFKQYHAKSSIVVRNRQHNEIRIEIAFGANFEFPVIILNGFQILLLLSSTTWMCALGEVLMNNIKYMMPFIGMPSDHKPVAFAIEFSPNHNQPQRSN